MTMIKKSFLTGLILFTLSFSATSLAAYGLPETAPAPAYNWYIGAFGGLTYTPSITDDTVVENATGEFIEVGRSFSYDNPNWDVGGHFGYRWDPVRLELEYLYQRSKYSSVTVNGVGLTGVSGNDRVHAAMANVLYDINLNSIVIPYLGGGIGYANIRNTTTNDVTIITPTITVGAGTAERSASAFGYQVMAGANFNVMENATFNLGYRFFGIAGGDAPEFHNHLFNVGLDYYFM